MFIMVFYWWPQGLPWPPVKSMCFGNRSHRCFNRWHRRSAPVKKHMKVDKVADMKVDKLADMKVDMVADMKVDINSNSTSYHQNEFRPCQGDMASLEEVNRMSLSRSPVATSTFYQMLANFQLNLLQSGFFSSVHASREAI